MLLLGRTCCKRPGNVSLIFAFAEFPFYLLLQDAEADILGAENVLSDGL